MHKFLLAAAVAAIAFVGLSACDQAQQPAAAPEAPAAAPDAPAAAPDAPAEGEQPSE